MVLAVKSWDFGIRADALQLRLGLDGHGLSKARRDGARLLNHRDNRATVVRADNAARLAGILNEVAGSEGGAVFHVMKRNGAGFPAPIWLRGFHVCREVTGILFAWVGLTAQTETPARVLPRLTRAVPMKTKLRQLLPNLCGGLFGETNPNPLSDNLPHAVKVRQRREQSVQHLRGRHRPVLLPLLAVNRQPIVFLLGLRRCALRFRCVGFVLLNCADLLPSP